MIGPRLRKFKFMVMALAVVFAGVAASRFSERPRGLPKRARPSKPQLPLASGFVKSFSKDAPYERSFVGSDGLRHLPESLRGLEIPGPLTVTAAGELVPTVNLRYLFDFFMSGLGEESSERVARRVQAYLTQQLPSAAQQQALAAFERYRRYQHRSQNRLDELREDSLSTAEILEDMIDFRRQFFPDDEFEAFYDTEDAYDRDTVRRLKVLGESGLSSDERQTKLAALEEELPAELRRSLSRFQEGAVLDQELNAFVESQLSEDPDVGIHARHSHRYGSEAADRLQKVAERRQLWQQRVQSYVHDSKSLSPTDAKALMERRFSKKERQRLGVWLEHQDLLSTH